MSRAALCALALLTLCGAVTRPLSFTVPDRTERIECIARRSDQVEYPPTLWADSARTRAYAARAGQVDTAWVLQSQDRSALILWVRACNSAGCCPQWSNRVVSACGLPDTNWVAARGPGGKPMQSYPWQRSRFGRVGYSLAVGDSAALAIVHQETRQRQESVRLVALYGRWALRGVYLTTPDYSPPRDGE